MPDRDLCVLLLPAKLEASPVRERAEELLAAPGTVAVEPAAIGYGTTSRLPALMRARVAAGQARRMALPGHPRAIVVFDVAQYPLARALLAEHPEAELWYGGTRDDGELHAAAAERAALRFGDEPERARARAQPPAVRAHGGARGGERPARLRAGRRASGGPSGSSAPGPRSRSMMLRVTCETAGSSSRCGHCGRPTRMISPSFSPGWIAVSA